MTKNNTTMKTTYFYSLATLALLTACTNSDEFESSTPNGQQKVEFAAPFVGKGLTRASGDINAEGLKSFKVKVWGQEVNKPASGEFNAATAVASSIQTDAPFNGGDHISWNSTTGIWASSKDYYYPRDKYTFRFAAFAPVEALNTATGSDPINGVVVNMNSSSLTFNNATAGEYGMTNIPLVQQIDNTTGSKQGWDLLVSNRVLSQPTNGADRTPISFTFQHILSRLSFYVYTTCSETDAVKVKKITAYLPKTNGTACYNQNDAKEKPTAEDRANTIYNSTNSTWESAKHDTWKWTAGAFSDITVSSASDFKTQIDDVLASTTYDKYAVFDDASGSVVSYKTDFSAAIGSTAPAIGTEFFLAPTPTNETGAGNVAKYHFYVTVNYTVNENGTRKEYYCVLPLYESDFYRFKQGWHHKLYLKLDSKIIRFISASVDNWDNHNEDMTVSREVSGWTAEQN